MFWLQAWRMKRVSARRQEQEREQEQEQEQERGPSNPTSSKYRQMLLAQERFEPALDLNPCRL